MFGSHHCQRCDASLPYKGMCEKCATGPAPKEEKDMTWGPMGRASDYPDHDDSIDARTAERRARFERAYMAALGGFCAAQPISGVIDFDPIDNSKYYAFETVRQWDAMMAELDGEEGI